MDFVGNLKDNILTNLISQNPDKPWDYRGLSENSNITMRDVLTNPIPCDYHGLSENSNITMRDVLTNPIPWDYRCLSENSNITMRDVLTNPIPWDYFNKSEAVLANIENRIQHRKDCYAILNDYMISDISHLVVMYL
jgi:hypothetical protein